MLLSVLPWAAAHAVDQGLKVGDTFPDMAGFGLVGKIPESLRGKVVLVDFWASWCEPCKQSFQVMEGLHEQYQGNGFVIVAVNLDAQAADMKKFMARHPVKFTVTRDPARKLADAVDVQSMPMSFLIGRDGRVVSIHKGFKREETRKAYLQHLETLLPADAPAGVTRN